MERLFQQAGKSPVPARRDPPELKPDGQKHIASLALTGVMACGEAELRGYVVPSGAWDQGDRGDAG